jgi:spoIIIJ-associated protein
MNESKPSLEMIAPTIEEAVARGAEELGMPVDQLEVEILDEGSRGVLGVGSREARVRLTVRGQETAGEEDGLRAVSDEAESPSGEPTMEYDLEDDGLEALDIARDIVGELLTRMGVEGGVEASWGEPDAPGKVRPLLVDIRGDDLSLLIGRRGETLSALQYITRLIVGKELHRPVAVVIDVEGYRARREETLRRLARRMAEQALERDRTMTLEPMPANERRIIHLELKDNPRVTTQSVGEGARRKVTIIPVH